MIKERNQSSRATREAADWYERLSKPPIETEDLEAWSRWNKKPSNNAAYARLEAIAGSMARMREDPDLNQAAAEALARGADRRRANAQRARARRPIIIGSMVAACCVVAIGVVWSRAPTYSTGVGETFSARLDDGSRVQLNTDSAVKVAFNKGERKIVLVRGQAFFDVAHDADHPFVVYAGDTKVRALGTRFEVRRMGQEVRVTLAQGSVEVTDPDVHAARWTLRPGQTIAVAPSTAPAAKPTSVDVTSATSWTDGKVTFQGVPLSAAVAEINRYTREKIVLAPGAPSDVSVTGVFTAGDNADFVDAVARTFSLKATPRPGGGTTLQPEGARAG